MTRLFLSILRVLPLLMGVVLAGCVTRAAAPDAAAQARAAADAAVAVATAAAAQAAQAAGSAPLGAGPRLPAGGPPPFAAVVKDARRIDGALPVWVRDERVWLELGPEQLGQPFLMTHKVRQGLGEGDLSGGLSTYPVSGAGGTQVVEFTRVHQSIRLQARNTDIVLRPDSADARALRTAFTTSLLGVAPVASQPHPERKTVLIDATSLVLSDLAGAGMMLQRQFRQGYALDTRNSVVTAVRGTPQSLVVETQQHWYTGSVAGGNVALPGAVAPSVPRWLPDTRSLLLGLHLSFMALPEQPMTPRRADARVGLFSTRVLDFSDEIARKPERDLAVRWRLQKQDPAAPLSEPVRPITFTIDRTVPPMYRDTVRRAILEWNKAFERIGFANAIVVRQQADDATDDTLDPGHAAVRWLLNADPSFSAIGQTQVDPRSGEIMGANIALEGLITRSQRFLRSQLLAAPQPAAPAPWLSAVIPGGDRAHARWCQHGDGLAEQAAYALDLMDAWSDAAPDDEQARQFMLDYLTDTVLHEVGHALGLRHNFRGSRAYTEAELSDPEFTRAHGTSGSVMDYVAVNLAPPGRPSGVPFQLTLGPYDYWAIEYAYRTAAPADEEPMLRAIAARSAEAGLAFGTDEDVSIGLDAETLPFDLGADPLAFAAKRLEIARELFRRQTSRVLPDSADYSVLQRSLAYALHDATRAVSVLVRQLGGLRTLRDHPGTGRDPIQSVDGRTQREAFELVVRSVFDPVAFQLPPALQRRLAPDFLDRDAGRAAPTDFNLPQRVLELQRAVLGYLLGPQLPRRLTDANAKLDEQAERLELAEIYRRVGAALWSELAQATDVALPRRELQRDHVNRLAAVVLAASPGARVDMRSALRHEAAALLQRLDGRLAARRGPPLDPSTRQHWVDCAESLRQALSARVARDAA